MILASDALFTIPKALVALRKFSLYALAILCLKLLSDSVLTSISHIRL